MHRLFAAAALAAALLAVPAIAGAQSQPGTYAFTTVDEVAQLGAAFVVKGVLQGEPVATAISAPANTSTPAFQLISDQCHRQALLAQARPGQYVLEVTIATSYGQYLSGCRLRRAVP